MRRKKKQKGQGSKKKDTDISTVRLRAATKLLNQRKLLAAMLQDSNEKCKVGLWPNLGSGPIYISHNNEFSSVFSDTIEFYWILTVFKSCPDPGDAVVV